MATKQVAAVIRLVINAGQAKPAPPAGLNIMAFCKDFNARTAAMKDDVPVPVLITAYKDRTFEFVIKNPPASYFIKKAAGITVGSQTPGHARRGSISLKHVYEIAKVKQSDPGSTYVPLQSVCTSVIGTAKSMGVSIVP